MFFERVSEFVANHFILAAVFAVLLIMLVRFEFSQLTRQFKMISTGELVRLMNRENAVVVDISSLSDFEKAHIAGALHIALPQFTPENKELAKTREMPLVVVDRNGRDAQTACARLPKAGFTRVHCLDGGMNAWLAADMPTKKGKA